MPNVNSIFAGMEQNVESRTLSLNLRLDEEDQTIKRILAAAIEQFALVGIRRASLDDIAARANVSRMTIYRRIGKQETVVQSALLEEGRQIISRINESLKNIKTLNERIVEIFTVAFVELQKHPLWRQLISTEPGEVLPYLTLEADLYFQLGIRYIQSIIEESTDSTTVEPELLAQYIFRLFHSFFLSPDPCLKDRNKSFAREYFSDYLEPLLSSFIT